MSATYDNWERLVAAVIKRDEIRQLCLAPPSPATSSETSNSSPDSRSSGSSNSSPDSGSSEVGLQNQARPKLIFLGFPVGFALTDILEGGRELGRGTYGISIVGKLLQDVKLSDQEFLANGTQVVMELLDKVRTSEEEFKEQTEIVGIQMWRCQERDYHRNGSVSHMIHGKISCSAHCFSVVLQ